MKNKILIKKINFSIARKKLIMQWLIFSGVIFVIYFVQTLTGRYEHYESDVWEWLFKYITPPLSLMIGVLISQMSAQASDQESDIFYFRLAQGMSYFFLIILLLSAFLIPVIHLMQNRNLSAVEDQKSIMDALKSYNAFLVPVQGLSTLTLGLFFTKK
jgi:hypothetical protein